MCNENVTFVSVNHLTLQKYFQYILFAQYIKIFALNVYRFMMFTNFILSTNIFLYLHYSSNKNKNKISAFYAMYSQTLSKLNIPCHKNFQLRKFVTPSEIPDVDLTIDAFPFAKTNINEKWWHDLRCLKGENLFGTNTASNSGG